MDVILLERIENLGQMGDVVAVKPGYARNYLLPKNKALRATKDNLAEFETRRTQLEAVNLERRTEAEAVAGKMEGLSVVLIRQAGDNGQLYGSANARDIATSISEAGFSVARGQVQLDRPIKALGLHTVRVVLHPEVSVDVVANVARTEDEAALQATRGEAVLTTETDDEADVAAQVEELFEEGAEPSAEELAPDGEETASGEPAAADAAASAGAEADEPAAQGDVEPAGDGQDDGEDKDSA